MNYYTMVAFGLWLLYIVTMVHNAVNRVHSFNGNDNGSIYIRIVEIGQWLVR